MKCALLRCCHSYMLRHVSCAHYLGRTSVMYAIRCMAARSGKGVTWGSFKRLQKKKSLDLHSFEQGRARLALVLGRLGWMPECPDTCRLCNLRCM